jgi:hypothetical protein
MCIPGTNCTVAACCRDTCSVAADNTVCNDGNAATTLDKCIRKVCRGSIACSLSRAYVCPTNNIKSTTVRCYAGSNCNAARCCFMPIFVQQINITQPKTRSTFNAVASVRIFDRNNRPVGNATVTGNFRRGTTVVQTVNGRTANSGTTLGNIILRSTKTWAAYDRTINFCVTAITKLPGNFIYQPTSNRVTCVTVPQTTSGRRRASKRAPLRRQN